MYIRFRIDNILYNYDDLYSFQSFYHILPFTAIKPCMELLITEILTKIDKLVQKLSKSQIVLRFLWKKAFSENIEEKVPNAGIVPRM